ncbi:hypothetical protein SAMN05444722_3822 [Rhodovulum sp. ES.010]|nr:hypothetical protein SAMN05444722_3822 [Rhodovulum sp. ES.010]
MLATDANDEVIVEWGDNHRDVYVSGSDAALSLEEIAEIEGLKPGQINGRWLADHPEYGSSEDTALDSGAGYMLWRTLVSDSYEAPASHWLRLEAGYEYDMRIPLIGMRGESELHPFHITSYGAGEKPVLSNMLQTFGEGSRNLVISDVELGDGLRFIASGENYILENITSRGDIMTIQKVGDFTLRNSEVRRGTRNLADGGPLGAGAEPDLGDLHQRRRRAADGEHLLRPQRLGRRLRPGSFAGRQPAAQHLQPQRLHRRRQPGPDLPRQHLDARRLLRGADPLGRVCRGQCFSPQQRRGLCGRRPHQGIEFRLRGQLLALCRQRDHLGPEPDLRRHQRPGHRRHGRLRAADLPRGQHRRPSRQSRRPRGTGQQDHNPARHLRRYQGLLQRHDRL